MNTADKDPLFRVRQVAVTRGADAALSEDDLLVGLIRHVQGDWGAIGEEERQRNEQALLFGERLFSRFVSENGVTYWLVTEPNRCLTTILLPEEH